MARRGLSAQRLEGFTLVELLIGSALSVLVVSSLAAIALIAELRMGRDTEVNQSLRNTWSRTLNFISNEAQQANWIRTSIPATSPYACDPENPPSSPLVLEGPPNPADPTTPLWQVVYGVRANADATSRRNWRGFNRLVRCGPPFEALARGATKEAGWAGNLSYTEAVAETVIADQLAQTDPLQVSLFDTTDKDRNAQLSLFLSRGSGLSYPPTASFDGFHTQIRANRNPGFDVAGDPGCVTVGPADNQQPPAGGNCDPLLSIDSVERKVRIKEYNLPKSGTFAVQGQPNTTDVIYFKGNYASATLVYQSGSSDPCSRDSCYVSVGQQKVQITEGNVLVFFDRIIRL
jgi:hypothetical protein